MAGLKMARADDEEWQKVMEFARDLEDKISPLRTHVQDEQLGRWVRSKCPPLIRTVYGYRVLVDNCCDPKATCLEFKPSLLRAMEAMKHLPKVLELLRAIEANCPCGARPETINTHPHVLGCPVAEALAEVLALTAEEPKK